MQIYPPTKHINPAPFFKRWGAQQDKLFSHRMLAYPLRNIVITRIKNPLRKALVASKTFPKLILVLLMVIMTAWRIRKYVGKVTKENSVFKNVHVILDMADLVKACHHNPGREEMVNSALEISAAILEEDNYYRQIAYRMAYYLKQKMDSGEWVLDLEPFPSDLAHCWDDKRFLGGLKNG